MNPYTGCIDGRDSMRLAFYKKRYSNTAGLHHVCFVHLCPGNRRTVSIMPGSSIQLTIVYRATGTQHCFNSDNNNNTAFVTHHFTHWSSNSKAHVNKNSNLKSITKK